jgi:hypothetical protein
MKTLATAAVALLLSILCVSAQTLFTFGATSTISVGITTTPLAIPGGPASLNTVLVLNDGPQEMFVAVGGNGTTAALSGFPMPPGAAASVFIGSNTTVAAIVAANSTTMRLTRSNLPATLVSFGSSGIQVPYNYTPLSPMQVNVTLASATSLTIPAGATYAVVCAANQNVTYSIDGTTTPTSSIGTTLASGQCVPLAGPAVIAAFKAIETISGATINVSYFR